MLNFPTLNNQLNIPQHFNDNLRAHIRGLRGLGNPINLWRHSQAGSYYSQETAHRIKKKITHETTIVKNKHLTNSVKLEEIEILEVEKNISEISFLFCCN